MRTVNAVIILSKSLSSQMKAWKWSKCLHLISCMHSWKKKGYHSTHCSHRRFTIICHNILKATKLNLFLFLCYHWSAFNIVFPRVMVVSFSCCIDFQKGTGICCRYKWKHEGKTYWWHQKCPGCSSLKAWSRRFVWCNSIQWWNLPIFLIFDTGNCGSNWECHSVD